jgi:uncharacterized cupin superfamily protein
MDKPSLNIVRAADIVGLKRTGVNVIRVPAGRESYVYHSHHFEEEWIYLVAGRAIALIDEVEYEVTAGDFIGFPAPSVAHQLRNPGPDDLVYLSGGENREFEVADFPRLGKRLVRRGNQVDVYDAADARPLTAL